MEETTLEEADGDESPLADELSELDKMDDGLSDARAELDAEFGVVSDAEAAAEIDTTLAVGEELPCNDADAIDEIETRGL